MPSILSISFYFFLFFFYFFRCRFRGFVIFYLVLYTYTLITILVTLKYLSFANSFYHVFGYESNDWELRASWCGCRFASDNACKSYPYRRRIVHPIPKLSCNIYPLPSNQSVHAHILMYALLL